MKVSIVIPVYNEAGHLEACLEAIAAQTVWPHEVIVVDNNSTDGSDEVAMRYAFVTLLRETKQGVVHARDTGFNAATVDIIGRIDADTLLPADWVESLLAIFADPSVSAVSGAPHYYDFALDQVADSADRLIRAHLARQLADTNFLWGANMAMRRLDWLGIRDQLCIEAELHEDFDLGIHLQGSGRRVDYDARLMAGVSTRRIDMNFLAFVRYTLASPRTYARHHLTSRRHMYPVLALCWLAWLPGRLIYRWSNPTKRALASRVDPTTNIA